MADDPKPETPEERAAKRGRFDVIIPNPDLPSLSSPATVEGIVRDALVQITKLRAQIIKGGLDDQALAAGITRISDAFQAKFYGRDQSVHPTEWNTPEQLGQHLVKVLGGSADDAPARMVHWLIREVVPSAIEFENDRLSDEMLQAVIDDAVAQATAHLLGMPPEVLAGTP